MELHGFIYACQSWIDLVISFGKNITALERLKYQKCETFENRSLPVIPAPHQVRAKLQRESITD